MTWRHWLAHKLGAVRGRVDSAEIDGYFYAWFTCLGCGRAYHISRRKLVERRHERR